ncbi:AAA family ATPase [Actinoplanes bogorensis]|uniref:AAA family ATPase n=1 Tax=Paractinoplanes bogorensis TaxID=1610840 RepID=A0ABS5YRK2_9ACTN|nr:LuxR family transcriptional regulator [Actinoplanes bogorensis]MBU2666070.1 AAA family ATPase [Actinoplanes bogorensis]
MSSHGALFGREAELDRFRRFLDTMRHDGDVRVVRGEPGVGKSALLSAVADLAEAADVRVLRASGSEFEADVSYSLLNQLLLPLYAEIQRLPPALRDALTVALGFGAGPAPAPLLVGNAALSLVSAVARKTPLLLIVDDVQWVDRPSAVVLGFIARRVTGSPVGVIAASRTGSESFLDRHGLPEVTVEPLTTEAAARLIEARSPGLAAHARQGLLDLAQGNPLALLELPSTVTGQDGSRDPSDVVPLSERLQAIFTDRIAGLPDATRLLLLLASFEGSGEVRTLRGMTDLTHLAPAERTRLVRVDHATGRIVFRHPLIQSAIVAMSTYEERRRAHLAIADALPGDLERRSWHLAAATAGPDEAVAAELEQAAHRVRQRGDTLAAITALMRAAELSTSPEGAARRLAEAAYIGAEAGGSSEATNLLARSRGTDVDATGALHAAGAAALLMINGDGDVHTAHRLLAGAIETGEHGWRADDAALDEAMHTLLLLSWMAASPELTARFQRLLARLEPRPSDPLSVMSGTFTDLVRTGRAALPGLEALIATLPGEPDLTRVMRIGSASVYLDRLGENREYSWRILQEKREGGAPRLQLSAMLNLCLDGFLTGRWDESEALATEAQQVCDESGLAFLTWHFLHTRALIAAGRGRSGEAFALADEITRWALARGMAGPAAIAHHPRALAAAADGNFESAYQHAAAASPAGVLKPYLPNSTWLMFDMVEAALRTGRTAEARAHAEAMRAANVAELSPRMRLIQHGVDALVLDGDEAAARLEQTLDDPAGERWLYEASRIRLAFAERLRRDRNPLAARTHLHVARAGFAAMGAEPWLARATAELRAAGYRPVVAGQPTAVLTGQELEIASLAAGGLTNKQIGERLYLSHRTVSAHLYRIFPKLGISARAGLRDALSAHFPDHLNGS